MVTVLFFVAGALAIVSTALAVTRPNAVHALLYLIVAILSLSVLFYLLGAPFAAALEVIVYAGAIVVLLLFVVMMLNLSHQSVAEERTLLKPSIWIGPGILAAVLLGALIALLSNGAPAGGDSIEGPAAVGTALFRPYLVGVEIASFLLISGVVGAYHLGRRLKEPRP